MKITKIEVDVPNKFLVQLKFKLTVQIPISLTDTWTSTQLNINSL